MAALSPWPKYPGGSPGRGGGPRPLQPSSPEPDPAPGHLPSPSWGSGHCPDAGGGGAAADQAQPALIGPNALIQLVEVLDRHEGRAFRDALCTAAGVAPPPPDAGMWPEAEAAALHRALRAALPGRAPGLLRLAGQGVADYVLRHRIPGPVRLALRTLPGPLAAPLLSRAIDRHAWTFAGAGAFRIAGRRPLTFALAANPLIAAEAAPAPICHWHAAVFERLFRALVWPRAEVAEVACAACGAPDCVFEVRPH